MDALKLLDSDCWRLVFRQMDAKDLMSCRQVCKPFQHLLDDCEFQVKWKFKLVLPHLTPYLKSIIPSKDKDIWSRLFKLQGVSWKDLYALRLVCHSWHQSVDKYAEEEYEPALFPNKVRDMPLVTCLKSAEEIEEFQEKFVESRNPFPLRTVCMFPHIPQTPGLGYQHAQETEAYIQKVIDLDFVELFGRNISKLELNIDQHFTRGPLPFCKLIRKVTLHMPNLTTLSIGSGKSPDVHRDDEGERDMTAWIKGNELGELPKLTALKIDTLDEVVEDYLLKEYAPQLTVFEGRSALQRFREGRHTFLSREMETLKMILVNPETRLRVLQFLKPPLISLEFTVSPHHSRNVVRQWRCWNIDEVLKNLKHLPLENLDISLFSRLNLTEAGLKLEDYINQSIRTLRIHFVDCYGPNNSFNFLEALTKLEELELWIIEKNTGVTAEVTNQFKDFPEIVKLNEYLLGVEEKDMYQSNIWEKVPSLKTLSVKWVREDCEGWEYKYVDAKSAYTRQEYESGRRSAE